MDIDDFDDEFDDIQLDAESLKALQDTEDRYTLHSQTSGVPTVKKEPPNQPSSRLNVVPSPRPARIVVKHENEDDLLPDVSVNSDGTYSFQPTQRPSKQPPPLRLAGSLAQPKGTSLSRTSTTPTERPERLRESFVPQTNTSSFARPIAPIPKSRENASVLGPRRTNNARSSASTSKVGPQERHRTVIEGPQSNMRPGYTAPRSHVSVSGPSGEVEKLRREMELLRAEKEAMAKSLTDTQNAKLMREGEIATLRRTMEKHAAAHTDALSRVRAEKSSIESKKVVMEAELKAEMERLKSKLVFKQQEIETAAMRYLSGPPSTVRRNRFVQPSQPHVTPVQSRTMFVRGSIDTSPTVRKPTTPVHRRIMPMEKSTAKKENSPFPGFHDSFQSRGIRKSPSKKPAVVLATDNDRPPMSMSSQERLSSDDPFQDNPPAALPDEEVEESVVQAREEEEPVRWRINWSEELHNLVFTHCSLLSGLRAPQPTMQILLSVVIPSSEVMLHLERYVKACGDLLTAFGIIGNQTSHNLNPEEDLQYQHLVAAVGASFLSMASIFFKLGMTSNIQCLLQLLQAVVLAVPSFREYLLTTPFSPDEPRSLHESLCVYLREHLDRDSPSQSTIGREGENLSVDALELLESLYWTAPDLRIANFEVFTGDVPLLSNLLKPSQPRWLIQRTMKFLMFLSTHVQLVPSLIAKGENQPSGSLHHIDVMLNHIHKIESHVSLKMGCNLIHSILIFLTNICIMHGKVEAMLTNFPNLAPSLLLCLTEISNRLWRDDEDTCMAPDEGLDALIDILIPSLNLFHYLFYGIDFDSQSLALDLRNVIFQAAALPAFNGIDHLYIVTMARLGYADVPDWLGNQRVVLVEDIQIIARELLETLVDGPEGDLVISAYCGGEEVGGSRRQDETEEETQDDLPNDVMDLDP